VDAHPHAGGQERQGIPQHRLLVFQAALPPVVERDPGQRDRPAAEADTDHQDVMMVFDQDAIDEELHALTFETLQRPSHDGMVMGLLGNPVVIKEAPQSLLFGCLGRRHGHGSGDASELGGHPLRHRHDDERQGGQLTGYCVHKLFRHLVMNAIIEG